MTKHKLKNIANRTIPVDGTEFVPGPGEVIEAEITPRLLYMIKNKFFEDLGPCPRKKEEEPKKEEEIQTLDVEEPKESLTGIPGSEEDLPRMPVKSKKKKGKKKKKKKYKEMIYNGTARKN